MKIIAAMAGAIMLCLVSAGLNAAERVPSAAPGTATTQGTEPITVAILDFEATGDLGKQIPDAVAAIIADVKSVKLVDRTSLNKTLQEHELNLTGLVDADKAVQVGKLVGAKILVTGKVFNLGKTTYVTAKMIGTETSLVEGVLVKGKENDDVSALITALSDKLGKQLAESGPKLIAPAATEDARFEAAKASLAKLKKPTVVVGVKEEHHGQARRPIDPAVETEIRSMLQGCGFTVISPEDEKGATADFILSGEAFSEYASRVGNLISCAARAEITVKSRLDNKVVLSTKSTERAVDLAENVAGKTALQKAGHKLGVEVMEYFAKNLPPLEKK